MSTRSAVAIRHVAMMGGLVTAITWLWHLGDGPLAGPSPSIDGVRGWIEGRDPVTLALSLTRVEALAFATYLLGVTVVGGVARWLALPRAVRVVERLTPHVLRGLLGGVATLGVMAAPTPTSIPAPTTSPTTVAPATTSADDAQATLHLLTDTVEPAAPVPKAPRDTWVVQPGDNLWLIAREHLIDETGTPVSDDAILRHWQRLIEVNRDRLENPDDPDLIFADQVLDLPAVDAG